MDLWHTLFFSSDFTDESEAVLLIGLLTEFRRILAAGQWLAPYICSCCFFVTQISQMTQIFSSWDYFVPQISQIYTDFFHRKVFHRISRMNQKAFLLIGLLTDFRRILAAGQWLTPYICCCCFWSRRFRRWRRFFFVGGFCPTDFTDLHRFFWISGESLCPISGGICNDRTGRLCEIPCHPMNKKICVICEICVT